jgi:hypothetical protein
LKQRWPSNQDYETEIHSKGFARDLLIFCALQNDENYFSMNAKDFEELEQLFWHARRELKNDANLGVRLIQFGSQLVELGAKEVKHPSPEKSPKIFRLPLRLQPGDYSI